MEILFIMKGKKIMNYRLSGKQFANLSDWIKCCTCNNSFAEMINYKNKWYCSKCHKKNNNRGSNL